MRALRWALLLVFLALLFSGEIFAKSPGRSGQISTSYFTWTLPGGWEVLRPAREKGGEISLMVGKRAERLVVSVAVMRTSLPAMKVAENAAAAMRAKGMGIGSIRQRGGICEFDFRGKAFGKAWFGSNGSQAGGITFFGPNPAAMRPLFANFLPKDPRLFPKF